MPRRRPDVNSELLKIRAERDRLEKREKQLLKSVQSKGLNEIVRIATLYQLEVDQVVQALTRRQSRVAAADTREAKPAAKVEPKFRHPDDQSMTWSGRGKKPRWIRELEDAGQLDTARIAPVAA